MADYLEKWDDAKEAPPKGDKSNASLCQVPTKRRKPEAAPDSIMDLDAIISKTSALHRGSSRRLTRPDVLRAAAEATSGYKHTDEEEEGANDGDVDTVTTTRVHDVERRVGAIRVLSPCTPAGQG